MLLRKLRVKEKKDAGAIVIFVFIIAIIIIVAGALLMWFFMSNIMNIAMAVGILAFAFLGITAGVFLLRKTLSGIIKR